MKIDTQSRERVYKTQEAKNDYGQRWYDKGQNNTADRVLSLFSVDEEK